MNPFHYDKDYRSHYSILISSLLPKDIKNRYSIKLVYGYVSKIFKHDIPNDI